jgi:hypothetical protein
MSEPNDLPQSNSKTKDTEGFEGRWEFVNGAKVSSTSPKIGLAGTVEGGFLKREEL